MEDSDIANLKVLAEKYVAKTILEELSQIYLQKLGELRDGLKPGENRVNGFIVRAEKAATLIDNLSAKFKEHEIVFETDQDEVA